MSPKPRRKSERTSQTAEAIAGVYIQDAATMVGTTAAHLRAWEQEGLVSPGRTASGYRVYSAEDIERMRRIQALVAAGVNAAGIARILDDTGAAARNGAQVHEHGQPAGRTLGKTIHEWRRDRGLTLRDLGAKTGLSPSYISAVERNKAAPSIASIQKLAAAFETNVLTLMNNSYEAPDTPLVRVADRRVVSRDKGTLIEDLSTAGSNLEPLLFTLQPGGGSEGAISHEGEEFLLLLSGAMVLRLDGSDDYELRAGDSMSFRSERAHQWTNTGDIPAVVLWLNTPRTF